VLAFRPIRGWCGLLIAAPLLFIFVFAQAIFAQDPLSAQDPEPSLGDLARSLRKKPAITETVIDNDNLNKVMEDAETRRASGWASVFSLAVPAKSVQIAGPDVMCSLAYTGKDSSQADDPLLLEDLPRDELSKLDGPASIDGDTFQVSTHNGTTWELHELVIGLTIVRDEASSFVGQLHLVPTTAGGVQSQDATQKQPDATILLHLKGTAAPSATVTFRTALNFALFPDQEWRWSILKAKGIPPQATPQSAGEQISDHKPSPHNTDVPPELNSPATTPLARPVKTDPEKTPPR
jgi:hypothetical protein